MAKKLLEVPHSCCPFSCVTNGIRDVFQWKTEMELPDEFLLLTTGFAHFVYFKQRKRKPPLAVYWALTLKQQYKNVEKAFGIKLEVKEGLSFSRALKLVKTEVNRGNPVVVGPLDLYHLEYREDFYQKEHALPHFVLAVGYDDEEEVLFVHDCDLEGVQKLSFDSLKRAWAKDEPGYAKKNTVVKVRVPREVPSFEEVAKRALRHKAEQMLRPSSELLGVPGMRRVAEEIGKWEKELDKKNYKAALKITAMYANTPPTLSREVGDFTGKRKELCKLLRELSSVTGLEQLEYLSEVFETSGELIREICYVILDWLEGEEDRREKLPELFSKLAAVEEAGYEELEEVVS